MEPVPAWWSWLAALGVVAVCLAFLLLPPGENRDGGEGFYDPEAGVYVPADEHGGTAPVLAGRILGQLSTFALAASLLLAYRRPVGGLLPPRLRLRAHAWLGAAILAAAAAHGALLPLSDVRRGWHAGVAALLLLVLHGASGAWRERLTGRWGTARWRWAHVTTGWAAFAVASWHTLVYGEHLGLLRSALLGPS